MEVEDNTPDSRKRQAVSASSPDPPSVSSGRAVSSFVPKSEEPNEAPKAKGWREQEEAKRRKEAEEQRTRRHRQEVAEVEAIMQASSAAMEEHRRDIRSPGGDGEELLRAPSGSTRRLSENGARPARSCSPPSRHLIQLSAPIRGTTGASLDRFAPQLFPADTASLASPLWHRSPPLGCHPCPLGCRSRVVPRRLHLSPPFALPEKDAPCRYFGFTVCCFPSAADSSWQPQAGGQVAGNDASGPIGIIPR